MNTVCMVLVLVLIMPGAPLMTMTVLAVLDLDEEFIRKFHAMAMKNGFYFITSIKISFTKIEAKIFFQNYFPIIHNLISFLY